MLRTTVVLNLLSLRNLLPKLIHSDHGDASLGSTLELADRPASVWVGPGLNWGEVYSFLEPYKLAVAGRRLFPVGVPGLLLASCVNFHDNQHGWAADNVIEYEVVLTSGEIVYVTVNSNPDLFWALKGGSSNFGITTRFKLKTFPSDKVLAGIYIAVANFSAFNTDPLGHVVPQIIAADETTTLGGAILYYDSDSVPDLECFRPFLDIPAVANTLALKTLAQFAEETGQLVTPGINDMFIAGTTVGKAYDQLLQGVNNVYNS